MNFLQLCQRARQEAGITGVGPTSVVNQSGQLAKLVDWVAQAWVDIQLTRPDWRFMETTGTIVTSYTPGQDRDYDPADFGHSDVSLYETSTFIYFSPSQGIEIELPYLSYPQWKAQYRANYGTRDKGEAQLFTILPNNDVRIEPASDVVTPITFNYKRTAQNFTADADVPTNLPDDFHMAIVWQALTYYGFYENAPEVLDQAETKFGNLLIRLEIEQLPTMSEDFEALA